MKNHLSSNFLFLIIVLTGIMVYLIFKPFLIALFLAFILSQLFQGWYQKIKNKFNGRGSLASFALCVILFFVLAIPFFITISLVAKETTDLYRNVQKTDWQTYFNNLPKLPILSELEIDIATLDIQNIAMSNSQEIATGSKKLGDILFSIIKKTYQETSHFIFMIFVTFFSLYYLFKDSDKIIKKIMQLSPLRDREEKKLLENFNSISKATLKGSLVIAVIQGSLTGLLFWTVGIPSPALWGLVTTIISLIPLLGSALIWLPAGFIMLLLGNLWQAIVIFAFGAIVISLIDNILRPKLVGNATSLHPILVFLSTIGGIGLFGITGILIGPIFIVLFITLLDIYQAEFKDELKEMNQ